jgi:2-methylcitrate dehydratase
MGQQRGAGAPPSVLERMAGLVAAVDEEALPPEVIHEAGRRLLDALGCMLGGSDSGAAQSVREAVGAASGPVTIVGRSERADIAGGALANSTALRYLDYMDGHPGPYPCHPCFVVPAMLAAAESADATGLALARAITLGYEIDIRMQLASGDPDITAHGWSGSTNLAFAIPAGAAGLLGLDREALAHSLAISAVHGPVLDATGRGQMAASKACVDGLVAHQALTAVQLARHGLHGKLTAFEGPDGFLAGVARTYDEAVLLAPVTRFRILDVYTKQYNAVKCAQSAVGSVLRLRPRLADWSEVAQVTLRLCERDWRNQSSDTEARRRPGNRDTANHSVVYCAAAALVQGRLRAEQFDEGHLADPRIRSVIDLTEIEPGPELTPYWPAANPATVELRTHSGRTLSDTTVHFPGHPANPVSDADLEEKFRSLAEPRLGPARASAVAALTRDLAGLASVRDLTRLLASPAETGAASRHASRAPQPATPG